MFTTLSEIQGPLQDGTMLSGLSGEFRSTCLSPRWSFSTDAQRETCYCLGGLQKDFLCLLCNHTAESRDHLFFMSPFSASIKAILASKLRLNLHANSLDASLDALIGFAGTKNLKYLTLLAWQACVYEIWRERNDRLHRGTRRPSRIILKNEDN